MKARNVLAAVAFVISAGTVVSCLQKQASGTQSGESVATERKYGSAQYGNGDYTLYFRNGKNVHEDCDGYTFDENGLTYIYEYFSLDIREWAERLRGAGIEPTVYVTHNPFKYCFVAFPSELLHGIGLEYIHYLDFNEDAAYLSAGGTQIKLGGAVALFYARPGEDFNFTPETWGTNVSEPISEAHKYRRAPSICVFFKKEDSFKKAETALKDAGIAVIAKSEGNRAYYLVMDASGIDWFTYDD